MIKDISKESKRKLINLIMDVVKPSFPNVYSKPLSEYTRDIQFIVKEESYARNFEYINVHFREYGNKMTFGIGDSQSTRIKIFQNVFNKCSNNKPIPYENIVKVIDRYESIMNRFCKFTTVKRKAIPTKLDDFFTKNSYFKSSKEVHIARAYYGSMAKNENARLKNSSSYAPIKIELRFGFTEQGNIIPVFIFILPLLTTLKIKHAIPVFSSDFNKDLDDMFVEFESHLRSCIVKIIANREKLNRKEKKALAELSDDELMDRFTIIDMILY